jgi:excisionase family DNA binding protein
MPFISTDDLYSTEEAARELGIGYATLYRWIKAGKLNPVRSEHRTYILKVEVERLKKEASNE